MFGETTRLCILRDWTAANAMDRLGSFCLDDPCLSVCKIKQQRYWPDRFCCLISKPFLYDKMTSKWPRYTTYWCQTRPPFVSRKGRPPSTLSGMDFTSLLEGMVSFLFVDAGEKNQGLWAYFVSLWLPIRMREVTFQSCQCMGLLMH